MVFFQYDFTDPVFFQDCVAKKALNFIDLGERWVWQSTVDKGRFRNAVVQAISGGEGDFICCEMEADIMAAELWNS